MFKPRNDKFSNKHKGSGKFDGKFGNFNKGRDKGFGGGFNKGRDKGFGGGGGWDREERVVFDAVCDRCGSPCTVPFKPTGSRPVLCNSCFKKEGDSGPKRFGDKDRSFQREDRGFRKGGGFRKDGGFHKGDDRGPDLKGLEHQLQDINRKLDLLLDSLAPSSPKKKKKGDRKKEAPAVIEEVDEDEDDLPDEDADDIDDDDLEDDEDIDDDLDADEDLDDEDDDDDEEEETDSEKVDE